MTEKDEWAWYVPHHGQAYGPFKSRDEAIADARRYFSASTTATTLPTIVVGKTDTVDPAEWFDADIDNLLEQADERLADNIDTDDAVFSVADASRVEAQKELNDFFDAWVRKWVHCAMGWYVAGGDEVDLNT